MYAGRNRANERGRRPWEDGALSLTWNLDGAAWSSAADDIEDPQKHLELGAADVEVTDGRTTRILGGGGLAVPVGLAGRQKRVVDTYH